ncbi:MAG: hypothetical protein Q9220_001720 [cf. Caloplaca sp. 1 TL-2023]
MSTARNNPRHECNLSHDGKSRQETANGGKSRKPYALNVVTNFSKPAQLAHRAASPKPRNPQQGLVKSPNGHARKGSSADVKRPDDYKGREHRKETSDAFETNTRYDPAIGLGFEKYENTRKAPSPPRDNKGPVSDLVRASSKMTTLSPSDRPIVIGISVPSDKLEQHTISPDVGPTPVSVASRQYVHNWRPSEAPSVIVTSAKNDTPWSVGGDEQRTPFRRRAPSSVYSRATNARGTPKQVEIPSLPPAHRRSPSMVNKMGNPPAADRSSTYTIFDEDERENAHARPYSGESQLRILKRSSTDSIATRHRSQGWWNHIMSPFFPRPGTISWRSASRDTDPVPDVPELVPGIEKHQQRVDDHVLPVPTKTRQSNSGHSSVSTDFSRSEAEREPRDMPVLQSSFPDNPQGLKHPEDDLSDWFKELGAAAEYYHASLHDQTYSTPYFECQNHVCIPRRLGNFPLLQGPQGESRGPVEDVGRIQTLGTPKDARQDRVGGFKQAPANRFSAAFQEVDTPKAHAKERPLSETTLIEDVDGTPVVQEAKAAPVLRAPAPVFAAQPSLPSLEADHPVDKKMPVVVIPPRGDSKNPPVPSPAKVPLKTRSGKTEDAQVDDSQEKVKPMKRYVAVMPPDRHAVTYAQPMSPEDLAPAGQSKNVIALDNVPRSNDSRSKPRPNTEFPSAVNHYHHYPYETVTNDRVTSGAEEPLQSAAWTLRDIETAQEKEKGQFEKPCDPSRGCTPKLKAYLNRGQPKSKKQKWLLFGITLTLVVIVIVILLLAMLLTRKGDHMQVQSQWLNLTGFPPVPTGISTVIQPDLVQESGGCIHPATLWSCAVPKEQQASIAPNSPDQPNFRIQIRFQNGSIAEGPANNSTNLSRRSGMGGGDTAKASKAVTSRYLRSRDFTSNLFSPSPSPPTREDQIFLGNTTDRNQQPFDGEATPFFLSFINSERLASSRMMKRDFSSEEFNSSGNGTDPFPDLDIPPPATNADGTASPASLYPLASAQPLRLYNRDTETEHYGFYTYFDRSIFLKSTALLNFTGASPSEIPDDENGGAPENAARVRCTWAQTRFLVQMWTRKGATIFPSQSTNSSGTSATDSPKNLTQSSANNFSRPGSFPYPISITLDRHGGEIKKKMIYCYGLDQQEHIIQDEKQIQLEDRAFNGVLVNPTQGPFGKVNVTGDQGGPGGIDGGTGGCGCQWANFRGGS